MTFMIRPALVIAATLGLVGCQAAPSAGPLQPQAVTGTCHVQPFFLVALSATPVSMTLPGAGQFCGFTVINPDIQAIQTAALVTAPASHGRAEAGLIYGGASAAIRYTPAPGYSGGDRFTITIEPDDKTLVVDVVVGK